MFRKNYLILVLMVTAVLFGSISAFAQIAPPVTGRVVMKDADGKDQPVANATVEAYRTDISSKLPADKTSKKGEFGFAGFQIGAVYALVVSGEGIDPTIVPGIRADGKNHVITVVAGNGKILTEEEVRDQLATSSAGGSVPTGLSEEDKKKAAEEEKALKDAEARNTKSKAFNDTIDRAIKEGNKAYEDKNYDLAIAKFEEGYQANPQFLGTAPGFLNNKGIVLRERAIDYHNKGVGKDKEIKTANFAKSAQDFSTAIDVYYESWTILKKATEAQKTEAPSYQNNKMMALAGARDAVDYAIQTEKIDGSKSDKVKELLEEYIKLETDKAKKADGQTVLADFYRATGDFDTAIADYRKILSASPNEPGALFGLGISLVSTGYNDDGSIKKAQLQEAANLLKKFTDVAPPKAKRALQDATRTLVELDQGNGITPKKS